MGQGPVTQEVGSQESFASSTPSANSRDPFSAPESSAPRISAPVEFGDFDMRSLDLDSELLAAASVLDEEQVVVAPPKKKSMSGIGVLLFLGIYLLQGATVWIGYEVFSLHYLSPPPAKQKQEDTTEKTFAHIVKVGGLVQKNLWRRADIQLRQAMSETPKTHPMFVILKTRNTQISSEIVHLNAFEKAKRLVRADQWVRALGLIARIPRERYAYRAGQKLRAQIFRTKVKPLLRTIDLEIQARKFKSARRDIGRVLAYDPNLTAAVDLQQRLDKVDPEGARKANEVAKIKFGKGFKLFRRGKFKQAVAYFKKLESTSSGLIKRKAASYQLRAASFVNVLARGIKASRSGNHNRAVALLLRAHSISRSMGGSKSRYGRRLARSIYYKGKKASRRKKFGRAMRYYKRALTFASYGPARSAIRRLQRKARSLYKQALVLKGVDNRESRKLLRQVMRIMPSSSRLYRKARRNLR